MSDGQYAVHIDDDFATMRYRVFVISYRGDERFLISPAPDGWGYLNTKLGENSGIVLPGDHKPLVEIPYGAAHAFLGALARTLGAVEHPEQLRSDFEYQRKLVDKLTDAVIDIARGHVRVSPYKA
jgi:hypothetical protein